MGDSVAYGYQASRDRGSTVDAAAFDHGYVDVIDHLLNLGGSRVTTVNMACPGESTITMVAGGCPWTLAGDPLHFPVDGPQLDAAVRFLTAHREHVPLVTLTVWGNDVVAFEQRCNFELACIAALAPTEIAAISTRLASVVAAIHLAAPRAMIVVTGPWDTEIDDLAAVDPLIAALDQAMRRATVGAGGRLRLDVRGVQPAGQRRSGAAGDLRTHVGVRRRQPPDRPRLPGDRGRCARPTGPPLNPQSRCRRRAFGSMGAHGLGDVTVQAIDDAAARRSGNLPDLLSSFIGRQAEIDEVAALVADHRLVTVTGPGGGGKTRLAHRVAIDLVPASRTGCGGWSWPG